MPLIVSENLRMNGVKGLPSEIDSVDLQYNYPGGINLKPGTPVHDRLVNEIVRRANESYMQISQRHAKMLKIEDKLTGFIDLDEEEAKLKLKDSRKPTSIVVPLSYATLQTILTYWTLSFSNSDTLFPLDGQGPEDNLGAILLAKVLDFQAKRRKMVLAMHTMWRDSLAYGFGVVAVNWEKVIGNRSVPQATLSLDSFGSPTPIGFERNVVRAITYEGNVIYNIDPLLYLPDPNCPIYEPQRMEYVGWIEQTNINQTLNQEAANTDYFNAGYVKMLGSARSSVYNMNQRRSEVQGGRDNSYSTTNPVDRINLYWELIPRDFGIGDSNRPEKWLFAVDGDRILRRAQPMNLDHNMFPVAVCAPEYDGHSAVPISAIELTYGLQEVVDHLMNSHVANVRKAVNDMIVVDPFRLNMNDLKSPKPGKLIRLRRSAWGQPVGDTFKQLAISDVTRNNMSDMSFISDLVQRVTGASDILQGVMPRTSERRTAQEMRDLKASAISRIECGARIGNAQAMFDITMMMAHNTQQLMTRELYVNTMGRWEEELRNEYGIWDRKMLARPIDIMVDFDILPIDSAIQGSEFVDSWIQLYQTAISNPVLVERLDIVRMYKHIARLMGAKSMSEFDLKPVPGQGPIQVVPDELVNSRVESGRYASVPQYMDVSNA